MADAASAAAACAADAVVGDCRAVRGVTGRQRVWSLVSLIGSLTEPESLGAQHIVINGS